MADLHKYVLCSERRAERCDIFYKQLRNSEANVSNIGSWRLKWLCDLVSDLWVYRSHIVPHASICIWSSSSPAQCAPSALCCRQHGHTRSGQTLSPRYNPRKNQPEQTRATQHNTQCRCSIELATNLRKVSKFPYWGLILVEGTY